VILHSVVVGGACGFRQKNQTSVPVHQDFAHFEVSTDTPD
jgi:hypothetical protein